MIGSKRIAVMAWVVTASMGGWALAGATTPDAWEKVKTFTHEQKKEAIAEGKKLMAAADKQIAAIAKDAKTASAEVKAEHQKDMKELKMKKKEVQTHLDKLGKATGSVWDATKEGFTKAGKELHIAYEKAVVSAKK